jgi:hypothetical protein
MLQVCYIYYREKDILVVASHRQADGMCPSGGPASMHSRDASADQIGEAVLRSLRGGRQGLTEEEGKAEQAHILKLAGEEDLRCLEKNWQLIHVWLEGSETSLHILPARRYQTGGYVHLKGDPEYAAPLEPQAIGRTIIKIISEPPLKPMRHIPSHT